MTDEREENSQKDEVKTLFVDIVHFTQIVPSYFSPSLKRRMCDIVFLYNYTVFVQYEKQKTDMFFIACRSKLKQMSNQLQIESYRISMRKLRTFYWKVTEFLNDDKITCLQRLAAFAINDVI